jgi:hypothetical protein
MNKAICTVGSGLGSLLMIGGGIGALCGAGWLLTNAISREVGVFIGAWIVMPILCLVLGLVFAVGWWQLSKWLYGHCREYWNK